MKVGGKRELPSTTARETEVEGSKDTVQDWESPKLQQMLDKQPALHLCPLTEEQETADQEFRDRAAMIRDQCMAEWANVAEFLAQQSPCTLSHEKPFNTMPTNRTGFSSDA